MFSGFLLLNIGGDAAVLNVTAQAVKPRSTELLLFGLSGRWLFLEKLPV